MIEDRLLVYQQPIVTAVQLVDLGQSGILAQQIGHRAALKPLAMQAPLAARRQQAVGDQHEQHLIPMRPFVEQVGKPERWFALDSTLEGDGFEPSVPVRRTTLFEPPLSQHARATAAFENARRPSCFFQL